MFYNVFLFAIIAQDLSGMKKKILFSIAGGLLLLAILAFFFFQFSHKMIASKTTTAKNGRPHMDQEKKVDSSNGKKEGKFSESKYAPTCWEIAPVDPISNEAKLAMYGIMMKKEKKTDGSIIVSLKPNDAQYTWKEIIVKPAFTLYFCDRTDDDEEMGMSDTDIRSNGDDYPILVDPQGNIVPGQNLP